MGFFSAFLAPRNSHNRWINFWGAFQVAIVDTNGDVVERYCYDAFGPVRVMDEDFVPLGTSNCDWTFLFHGEFLDADSGLYNYGYRYYHPQLGRWPSRDPIEEKGGVNLYGFVNNRPNVLNDLFGLQNVCPTCGEFSPHPCSSFKKVRTKDSGVGKEGRTTIDKGHYKEVNGCDGVPDYGPGLVSFTDACHKHDICYQTCGTTQSGCDDAMLSDMLSACDDLPFLLFGLQAQCYLKAYVIYGFLASGIGNKFEAGQDYHCKWVACCE